MSDFATFYQAGDFASIHDLYLTLADLAGGDVMLAPAHKRGGADWTAATRETLTYASGLPTSRAEVDRLCVLVDTITACDPSTTFLVGFSVGMGERPFFRQIAGPAEDKHVAVNILCRQLGFQPRMIPFIDSEPVIAANDDEPEDDARALIHVPPMHPDPFTPEAAGGLLGDIAKWITSTAIIPVPELSLASSLALLAGMFGDRCLGPTRSGVNLFLTTVLATAGGKGHPPKAVRSLADLAGKPGAVTNRDPTSYAAIERILRRNKSTVVVFDEFGITLQDVNSRHKSGPAASIRKFLLAIYDQAGSRFDGRAYASEETKKDDTPIDGPALTVLGMTTPSTLYAGLSEASVSDGFLNRFIFATGAAPEDIKPPPLHRDAKPPAELVDALRRALEVFPRSPGNLAAVFGKVDIEFDGGQDGAAYSRWAEVFMWEHAKAWDDTERHINGRASENTIRLATLRAISRDPAAPVVTVEDVEWGWAIVHRSIAIISDGIERHMAESPADALRKLILEALRTAKNGELHHSKLLERRGIRGAETWQLEDALNWLIASGQIEDVARLPKPGRGSRYRSNAVRTVLRTEQQAA